MSTSSSAFDAIAQELRVERLRLGVPQWKLAREIGTSQPRLADYERGARSPRIFVLERWLAALGYRLAIVPLDLPRHERRASIALPADPRRGVTP